MLEEAHNNYKGPSRSNSSFYDQETRLESIETTKPDVAPPSLIGLINLHGKFLSSLRAAAAVYTYIHTVIYSRHKVTAYNGRVNKCILALGSIIAATFDASLSLVCKN